VVVADISSVIPAQLMPSDLLIDPAKPEFGNSRLKVVSALRLLQAGDSTRVKPCSPSRPV
jgi:hypothetical protein